MKIPCQIKTTSILTKGLKIPLIVDQENRNEILKNLHNFIDKPLIVDIRIDSEKYKHELNQISADQRKKIFAIINDIANDIGEEKENTRHNLSLQFCQEKGHEEFSLSNCDKEFANDFIEYLLGFAFENGVQLKEHPRNSFDDVERYFAIAVKNRVCAVCGRHGDIHHIDAIGMGNNRNKVDDSKYRKVCLCRSHHTEAHTIGWPEFTEKYYLQGI